MTNDIRPFQDSDRAAIIERRNQNRPAHHQSTLAEWERQDATRTAGEVSLRLCAGEPAIAFLSAVDRGTTGRRKPGVCGFGLWIDAEQGSDALAGALDERAVDGARSREGKRVTG